MFLCLKASYVFSVMLQFLLLLRTHGQRNTKGNKLACLCFPYLRWFVPKKILCRSLCLPHVPGCCSSSGAAAGGRGTVQERRPHPQASTAPTFGAEESDVWAPAALQNVMRLPLGDTGRGGFTPHPSRTSPAPKPRLVYIFSCVSLHLIKF